MTWHPESLVVSSLFATTGNLCIFGGIIDHINIYGQTSRICICTTKGNSGQLWVEISHQVWSEGERNVKNVLEQTLNRIWDESFSLPSANYFKQTPHFRLSGQNGKQGQVSGPLRLRMVREFGSVTPVFHVAMLFNVIRVLVHVFLFSVFHMFCVICQVTSCIAMFSSLGSDSYTCPRCLIYLAWKIFRSDPAKWCVFTVHENA